MFVAPGAQEPGSWAPRGHLRPGTRSVGGGRQVLGCLIRPVPQTANPHHSRLDFVCLLTYLFFYIFRNQRLVDLVGCYVIMIQDAFPRPLDTEKPKGSFKNN